jgi:hypothetical protein
MVGVASAKQVKIACSSFFAPCSYRISSYQDIMSAAVFENCINSFEQVGKVHYHLALRICIISISLKP